MDSEQLLQAISKMIDEKLQPFNNELAELKAGQAELKASQTELKKDLREVKDKVNATYNLALEAWGQSTENRVWLDSTLKI